MKRARAGSRAADRPKCRSPELEGGPRIGGENTTQRADEQDTLAWMRRAQERLERSRARQAENMAKNAKRLQRTLANEESIGIERENNPLPSINVGLAKKPGQLVGVTEDGSPFVKGEDRAFPKCAGTAKP